MSGEDRQVCDNYQMGVRAFFPDMSFEPFAKY